MRSIRFFLYSIAVSLCLAGTFAQATSVTGTVTNKTTGKPAEGDSVALVDVQAAMREVAHATIDANGHYTLTLSGNGPYLVRVTHQGTGYFIAAPLDGAPGNIPIYDVAAKVDGVFIEADVLEAETENGRLRVIERYFLHNTNSPARTQWSPRTFEVTLPPDAVIANTSAQQPTGLPTSVNLDPTGTKGQYTFNFPIEPDEGGKDTLFQLEYTLPYTGGSYTFHTKVSLPAQSVGVLLPMSMKFAAGSGSAFQSVPEDPTVQTFVAKKSVPGEVLTFTVSGTGSMPQETLADNGKGQSGDVSGNEPGGGIGEPINTPDPLSKYKWWILGALALLLTAAAAFLLRKPAGVSAAFATGAASSSMAASPVLKAATTPGANKAALLSALKEELFVLENDKLSGTLKPEEYTEAKAALDTVLRRSLNRR